MRADINELTWRQMRHESPLLIKFFADWQLRICMDRLKLPCARMERMEVLREWEETQKRRHFHRGMVMYPVKREQ
jgi:hypothetical protein